MLSWLWALFTHQHVYGEEVWLAGHLVRRCEVCGHPILVVASMKEDRWRWGIDRGVDEPLEELEPLV